MRKLVLILIIISFPLMKLSSQPEILLDGFTFTEGPAIDQSGALYFTDVPNDRIYSYHDDILEVYLQGAGGANGLYFDREGNLIACAGQARQIVEISPDSEVTVLVDEYDGKKLNSPNDLWIDPEGGIYFTDPRYGNTDNLEQDGMHVYYFSPDKELIRVTDDLVRPNGIIGTANGKTLYIVDQGMERTYRYRVKKNGQLKGKKLFVEVGTDGMSIDEEENIYVTNGKNIDVYSPRAFLLDQYTFPSFTTNVVFSRSAVYVTTQSGQVFIIRK